MFQYRFGSLLQSTGESKANLTQPPIIEKKGLKVDRLSEKTQIYTPKFCFKVFFFDSEGFFEAHLCETIIL